MTALRECQCGYEEHLSVIELPQAIMITCANCGLSYIWGGHKDDVIRGWNCMAENWSGDTLRAENAKLRDTIQKLFDDWNNRGSDTTDIDQYLAWMELEEMLK